MSVETQFRLALLGVSAVAALIGDRLYPVTFAERTAFPAVAYQRISTQKLYSNDQLANTRWGTNGWARIQLTIAGDGASGYAQAIAVAAAIRDALKTFNIGSDQTSPPALAGAPNFVLNEWDSVQPNTVPPKFLRFMDVKVFLQEGV